MTEKTEWSHLPNAHHIDCVLASVKAHPEIWSMCWSAARAAAQDAARSSARAATWDAAQDAARSSARDAAWDAAWGAAGYAARDAILALVAYDDSATYLDMSSDQLKMWAILSENPAAILLLPAVTAFEKINELELA